MRFSFLIVLVFLVSCAEFPEVPEIEENRFLEDIPNTVVIDSIVSQAKNISFCDIQAYFHYDKQAFETAWDSVDYIYFDFEYPGSGKEISYIWFDEGRGYASPNYAYSGQTYFLRYQIILKNGRTSEMLRTATFVTDTP